MGVAWPDGTRVDLVAWLTQHGRRYLDGAIHMGMAAQVPCHWIAERVPASVVRERRAELQEEARRRQTTVSAAAWELARWTLLVTNCLAERLSRAEALALGEARWQVELLITRWKSLGQKVPADDPFVALTARAGTEVYGLPTRITPGRPPHRAHPRRVRRSVTRCSDS